jgi:16S rRNA (guanine966-N2)-methyltransferase
MGTLTITGGELRGRRVPAPDGRDVRPTPARVKEALFSILAPRMDDARVLDLFAGSGALGFESISRGAAHVTFVERNKATADALRTTARTFGIESQVNVLNLAAERAAQSLAGRYDLVFADPPFDDAYPEAVFGALRKRGAIDADTTIVYEHRSRGVEPADAAMTLERVARYGEVSLAFLRPTVAA